MSTTIDNEVVKLEFENGNFETNVSTSLSTLEKLKKALNFDGLDQSIKTVGDQVGKIDVDSLNASTVMIQNRFSVLGAIATGALQSIGATAVSVGANLLKSLTVQPLIDGFQEYEMTMNSVKTIMANLPNETIDHVNSTLATLNKYSDETIYSFSDMTHAIGQFTAAGVDLDSATTAIKGMANVAAGAGASNSALARAEYQVSQALQSGTIKLMDWNSLVQAGMANPELQEQIKATAREQGVAVDSMIAKYGSFRDSLSEGWLTADIFVKTMAKAADKSNEWGARLTDAATQVNTATQLGSVIMESIGSSWTNTWQLIVGDYEQSKNFFTGIYNEINPLVDAIGNFRNGILQTWSDLGGRANMMNGIKDGIQGIINLFGPFSSGLSKLLGGSGNALADMSKAFADSMAAFKDWSSGLDGAMSPVVETANTATEAVEQVTDSVKDLGDIANQVIQGDFGNGEERVKALREAGYCYEEVQNKVNELLGCDFRYDVQASKTTETISNQATAAEQAAQSVEEQSQTMVTAQRSAKNFSDTISGVFSVIDIFKNGIDVLNAGLNRMIGVIGHLAGSGLKIILAITGGLGRILTAIDDLLNSVGVFKTMKDAVNGFFDALNGPLDLIDSFADVAAEGIGKFFDIFVDFIKNAQPNIAGFTNALEPAINVIRSWLSVLKDAGGSVLKTAESAFSKASGTIGKFAETIGSTLGGALSAVMPALSEFGRFAESRLSGAATTLANVFETVKNAIKSFADVVADNLGDALPKAFKAIQNGIKGAVDGLAKLVSPTKAYAKTIDDTGSEVLDASKTYTKASNVFEKALGSIKDSFSKAVKSSGITDFASSISNGFKSNGLSGVKDAVVEAFSGIDVAGAIRTAFDKYIVPAASTLGDWVIDLATKVSEEAPKIAENAQNILSALADGISDAFDSFVRSINPSIESATDTIKGILSGFGKAFSDAFGTLAGAASDIQGTLSGTIESFEGTDAYTLINEVEKALCVGAAYNLSVSLSETAKTWENISGIGKDLAKSVKKFASGIDNVGKGIKWAAIAAMIISVATAVGKIADSITALGQLDPGNLVQGVAAVSGIVAIIGTIVGILTIYNKYNNQLKTAVKEVSGQGNNPIDKLTQFITSLKSSMSTLSTGVKIASIAAAIGALAGMVALLSWTVSFLGKMDTGELVKGLAALGVVIGAAAVVMKTAEKMAEGSDKGSNTVLKMAASVALIAGSFVLVSKQLQKNDLGTTVAALGILGGALIALTTVDLILSHFAGESDGMKAATSVLMLSGSLVLIAYAFSQVSSAYESAGTDAANQALRAVIILLGVLTLVDIALSSFSNGSASLKSAAAVVGLAYAVNLICQGIASIPDPSGSVPIVMAVETLLLAIGVVIGILASIDATGAIETGAGLGIVVASLALLVHEIGTIDDPSGAISVLMALETVAVVLGVVLGLLSSVGPGAALAAAAMVIAGLAFLELAEAMKIGSDALATTVEALDQLSDVLAKMGSLDTASLDNLNSVLQELGGFNLTSALAGITGGGDAVAETVDALTQLSGTLDIWNSGDYSQAASNISSVCEAVSTSFTSLGSVLGGITGGGEAIASSLSGISDLGNVIQVWNSGDYSLAATNIQTVCEAVGNALDVFAFDGGSAQTLSTVPGPLYDLAGAVQAYSGMDPSLGSTIGYILANLATNLGYLAGAGAGASAMATIPGPLYDLAGAVQAFAGVDGSIGSTIGYILANLATNLGYLSGAGAGATVMAALPGPLSALASSCQSFAGVDVASIASGLSSLSSAIASFTFDSGGLQGAAASLSFLSDSCAQIASSAGNASWSLGNLASACQQVGAAISSAASSGNASFNSLGSSASSAASTIQSSMSGAASNVSSAMNSMASAVSSSGQKMASDGSTYGTQTGQNFARGISGSAGTVASVARYLALAAKSSLASEASSAFSTGQNFAMGFVMGIRSQISAAASAAAEMAAAASSAAKSALDIHSPSRVMRWVGQMFDYGMRDGITDFISDVQKAAAGMSEAASDAVSSPVISPVWDDSSISGALSFNGHSLTISPDISGMADLVHVQNSNDDVVAVLESIKHDIQDYSDQVRQLGRPSLSINGATVNGYDDIREVFVDSMYELVRREGMLNGNYR